MKTTAQVNRLIKSRDNTQAKFEAIILEQLNTGVWTYEYVIETFEKDGMRVCAEHLEKVSGFTTSSRMSIYRFLRTKGQQVIR